MEKNSILQTYMAERLAAGRSKTAIVDELAYILGTGPRTVWHWLKSERDPAPGLQRLLKIWMSLSAKERGKYWE